jgi:hypothetical protein
MQKSHPIFLARISFILIVIVILSQYPAKAIAPNAEDQAGLVYLPLVANGFSQGPNYGDVTGTVRDARTIMPIAGAEVCYDGITCTATDSEGKYSFLSVPTGGHDLTANASGYLGGEESVVVLGGSTLEGVDFDMLPTLSEGEIRIEVRWVDTPFWYLPPNPIIPNDLNLHLWTNYAEPKHHVWVDNPDNLQYCLDLYSEPYACYEADKRNGSGPDSIVVTNQNDVFKIAVLNENASYPWVPSIKDLDVRLQIYDESGPMLGQPLQIAASGDGDLWYALDLYFGEIELQNCLAQYVLPGDDPPPDCH